MKLKFLLLALVIIWGSGCVAYVTPHDVVTVNVRPPRTVVRVTTHTPPIVHHVHRTRPVVRHVHHRHCGHTVSHDRAHHHRSRRTVRRNNNNRRDDRHHRQRRHRRPRR